ncbi:hypothetical protein D3C80_1768110 [compost metagenome]
MLKAAVGSVQGVVANLGEVLDGGEGVGRRQALLVSTVDMPAESVHQAQHTALLAVGRHFQQGLGLQFVDHVVELLLLHLHGFTQGDAVGNTALQLAEVVAQALQQRQLVGQQLP